MSKAKLIEHSVLAHVQQILVKHGVSEAVIVFPLPIGKDRINISCNIMKPPHKVATPLMDGVKSIVDQFLIAAQTPQG